MKALKVLGLTFVFGLVTTGISLADNLRIAYVDLAKVFDNYAETKQFDGILQSEGENFEKQRDAMIQKIQDAQGKLDLMKDSEKAAMEQDIEKQKNDVIAFDKEKREDLTKRRDDKVREILGEIQKQVASIAQKDGYNYVLNNRVMVYGDPQFDITDEVMKSLNESSK